MATLERTIILAILLILPPTSTANTFRDGLTASTVSSGSSSRELSRSVFDFGLRLQRSMLTSEDHGNIVISPTSIYGVLALTLLGSVGKTYDELAQVLQFSPDLGLNQARHRELGSQLHRLNSRNSSKTLYADGIFLEQSARLRDLYTDFLHNVYNATVSNVDFTQQEHAQASINRWVAEHTEHKIAKLLVEPLPESTKVVLASALYFSGQWETPFVPQHTMKLNFSCDVHDHTKDVLVDSMLNAHRFRYALSLQHDCELLALPYNDTKTVLYVLKPLKPERKSLDLLLQEMDGEKIENMIDDMSLKTVVLRFPKLNVSAETHLRQHLEALGMRSMFSPVHANFALMVDSSNHEDKLPTLKLGEDDRQVKAVLAALPNPGLYVDTVLHNTVISINEYGTEAVAATAAFISRTSVNFYLHSPFFFFIRNEDTKLVTFSAAIYDPTK